MKTISEILPLAWLVARSYAQAPPPPADQNVTTTTFFNHTAKIQGLFGQSFLLDNIPFIDIPDSNIEEVYYYRFSALQRHLRYVKAGAGYIITEFVQPQGYEGPYDTIDAAAGHQIEEARWLRSSYYAEDYIQVYTRGPADSHRYTNWIHHTAWGTSNVTGDAAFLNSQLDGLNRMWHLWDEDFNSTIGLYFWTPNLDAQEYSLPGYISEAADPSSGLTRDGPNAYRPSHNAYMVAAAQVIAAVAEATGNTTLATQFAGYATSISDAVYTSLWSGNQSFFVDNIEPGFPAPGQVTGREEVGFFPFRFGIGLQEKYMNPTLEALHDTNGFNTTYYPPTLEKRNQYFIATKPDSYCCYWQGQNWPYSTAHFLKSLTSIYRTGASSLTVDQYYDAVSNYATTQHKAGVPYVAESHYPSMDGWSADTPNRSEHYMHSTNCDIVLTGLLGVVPRSDNTFEFSPIIPSNWTYFAIENLPYHGFLITVLYDQSGTKYNVGSGLTIYANGNKIYSGSETHTSVTLPDVSDDAFDQAPAAVDQNVAANPFAGQSGAWPVATASYTWKADSPNEAIDGLLFYDETPNNRWTNYDDPSHPNDTLTIQLPRPRNFTGIALAVFSDVVTKSGGGVDCPAGIEVTDAAGAMLANETDFASTCKANDINVISFDGTVQTDLLNINFYGKSGYSVGVTEVQLWVPANTGPFYYASDAIPGTSSLAASIAFDTDSKATSTGAVMEMSQDSSTVVFPGVYSASGGFTAASLSYKNNGSAVTLDVSLNQISAGSADLQPTGNTYATADLDALNLWRGMNFVTFTGGGSGVFLEGLTVS